jgi:hypothetical protein
MRVVLDGMRQFLSDLFFLEIINYFHFKLDKAQQIIEGRDARVRSSSGYSPASHRGSPVSKSGLVMWDLWWTKWRWGRFSQSTWVSPANLHSTNFSTITITYHPELAQ